MWTLVEPNNVINILEQGKEVVFVSLENESINKPFAVNLLQKQMTYINQVIENATANEKNALLFYTDTEVNNQTDDNTNTDNQNGDNANGD